MNVKDIFLFNAQILFITLSIIAIFDYVRHPNPRRRDFALMASALGLPFSITFVRSIYPFQSSLLDVLGGFALFSQPYFLFRLLQYFRPSRRGVGIVILIGFVLCCASIFILMPVNRVLTVTAIFSYCAIAEAYCTWGFYQGMRATAGTLRRRLGIITVSSAVFTLAFTINVIKAQIPTLSPAITPIAQTGAAISAILFYAAFIPPRWLRRAWQMEEFNDYLLYLRTTPVSENFLIGNFQRLSQGAVMATNAQGGAVLRSDQSAEHWDILAATDPSLFEHLLHIAPPLVSRAAQGGKSVYHAISEITDAEERRQLQALGARSWLFVPIRSQERQQGLLVVALRDRSLFIDDDLNVLELLAHECALILDNHRLIDELQHYSEGLERKVAERTAALQRSNEELRRYAYVASHDLQEPLRTVTSYLQLIELRFPDKLDAEGREFIAFAVEGARRMKHMIHDLLTYSRVENRTRKFGEVNVQRVLDGTMQSLEARIAETGTRITQDPLPLIIADEELIEHLFQNLIGNAIKYRSERTLEIHVGAVCKDQHWVFSVRDNGIGIEKEFLERIFIIFQRLHTQEKYPGTGIGLAICKKAVELHDGRIWAESEVGQGTTFYFTIPVRTAADLSPLAKAS